MAVGSRERPRYAARAGAAGMFCLVIAGCSSGPSSFLGQVDPRFGSASNPRVVEGESTTGPRGYHLGKPYQVGGRTYVPREDETYRSEGQASWYGGDFHGRRTANGATYDMHKMTAAHPTLPLPSYVRVTNLGNGRSIVLRVNDRGPYHGNRVIDVSIKAADLLGFRQYGVAKVRVEYVGRAPLTGQDDAALVATLREGTPAPAPSVVRVASGDSFVPDLGTTSTVVRSSRPAFRGEIPTPPERPFDLGLQ